jgi:hypothetical protein
MAAPLTDPNPLGHGLPLGRLAARGTVLPGVRRPEETAMCRATLQGVVSAHGGQPCSLWSVLVSA